MLLTSARMLSRPKSSITIFRCAGPHCAERQLSATQINLDVRKDDCGKPPPPSPPRFPTRPPRPSLPPPFIPNFPGDEDPPDAIGIAAICGQWHTLKYGETCTAIVNLYSLSSMGGTTFLSRINPTLNCNNVAVSGSE